MKNNRKAVEERQSQILNLPELVFPAAMVVFGYPTDQQKAREKPEGAGTALG